MLPEWEIEETIANNPSLLEAPSGLDNLKVVDRQRFLPSIGGYIDLLLKSNQTYVIVELKGPRIDSKSKALEQILKYRKTFSRESLIPEGELKCVLVSSEGFSEEVETRGKALGVMTVSLDERELVRYAHKRKDSLQELERSGYASFIKPLLRRNLTVDWLSFNSGVMELRGESQGDIMMKEIRSIITLVRSKRQDSVALARLAEVFRRVSKNAPIFAHEVQNGGSTRLESFESMWFWLFYSSIDRRANATLFIKARQALEAQSLFWPQEIVKKLEREGEEGTIESITRILERAGFPLIREREVGKNAVSKSIVDSARYIASYEFSFEKLFDCHSAKSATPEETCISIWSDVRSRIHGAGPRIASQFVRGMVLKGPWKRLPLTDDRFLESNQYNAWMAGETRICLVGEASKYQESLSKFADQYLEGNRGIVAHVLWYIRKKYCGRSPKCEECPMAGYCHRPNSIALGDTSLENLPLELFNLK